VLFKGIAASRRLGPSKKRRRGVTASDTWSLGTRVASIAPGVDVLMKLVTAIIRPFKLDEIRDALTKIGVPGLTVTEVRGYGRQKGHTEIYRGAEYAERFLPKIKVEIACLPNQVDKVIETIISSAKTGKIGDGKIFVYGIDHAVRIRTGETDTDAI
jgi:nitrogen regulatory protein P-II 2